MKVMFVTFISVYVPPDTLPKHIIPMSSTPHILVIPFDGQGHLFPSIELCNRLSDYKTTLVIPSSLSSSLPQHHPHFDVALLTPPAPPADSGHPYRHHNHFLNLSQPFADLLSDLSNGQDPPKFAIIDVMCEWAHQPCQQYNIQAIGFFTSSAACASVEFALGKISPNENPTPASDNESFSLPGLPEHIRVTHDDIARWAPPDRPHRPPEQVESEPGSGPRFRRGPRFRSGLGSPPPWVAHTENTIALMFNTCEDLERQFLEYLRKEIKKPIFCLGPLLPEQFSSKSVIHDGDLRSKRDQNNIHEEEVNEWLDTKPRGSVLYVSFGSEVGPSSAELTELAIALDESNRPFIWVIQPGSKRPGPRRRGPHVSENADFFPDGFLGRVEGRALIVRGWAPQLLILSHASTGGFLSHCGWNSTLEAILRGVPLLTWPIRGDQHYNAKLIADHLKVALMIKGHESMKKDDILNGIEKLMADMNIKKEAASLACMFENGMSPSYRASLDTFRRFIEASPRAESSV